MEFRGCKYSRLAEDKHKTVDDTPFGGGSGMLLKADVIGKSLDKIFKKRRKNFLFSPKGKKFDQKMQKIYPNKKY